MPELAEVAYYCSRWNPGLGHRVGDVEIHGKTRCFRSVDAAVVARDLNKARLIGSRTHGKRMLFQFSGGAWLGIHLGMTGKLLIRDPDETLERHDHLALRTDIGWLVYNDPRQFGLVEMHTGESLPPFWSQLPPEPNSAAFNLSRFEAVLGSNSRRPLKSHLLDQSRFPGLGNWMADEILWQARIRPQRSASQLAEDERKALYRAIKRVSKTAMKRIAADFSDPPRTWLFHRRWRNGGLCPKTGAPLERCPIGGRTTCWSRAWQS